MTQLILSTTHQTSFNHYARKRTELKFLHVFFTSLESTLLDVMSVSVLFLSFLPVEIFLL